MLRPAARPIPARTAPAAARRADDRRWQAVLDRDAAADGSFVTCVATTGIYCRPSCPARHPRRENVVFQASPAAAEAAGFRPCKRCRPDQPSLAETHAARIAAACRLIERAEEAPKLAELAAKSGLSPHHFHRLFRAATGVTPKAYAAAHRRRRVRDHLKGSATVTEAIHAAGFNSSGRFYAGSDASLGMTPTAYRAGGRDTSLRYAFGRSSLGAVLVAASGKGVAAILLGDDTAALLRELEDRFPKAELIGGDRDFQKLVAKVVAFVETPSAGLDLPLDIQGTAFQERVWRALRKIPPGKTATYTDIAKAIGKPAAARAVAAACAANHIAIAVPCHRVVRSDGALAGYYWGIERKRTLLEREKKR